MRLKMQSIDVGAFRGAEVGRKLAERGEQGKLTNKMKTSLKAMVNYQQSQFIFIWASTLKHFII